ncbi:MAG: hypothetical protein KKC77_19375, partial [Proteobacteria bacterium]|nr:hypothetical protein [Pseudomonadota bacterium]
MANDAYHNKEYSKFCKSSKMYKIIDLNVHEQDNTLTWKQYVKLVVELNVNEVIVPDVLNNQVQTL